MITLYYRPRRGGGTIHKHTGQAPVPENKMNERIRQLAEQAGYKHPDAVGECEDYAYFDHEKFAELIVRECAQHALDFNNNIQHLPDKVMRGNLDRVQDYIKDRMGVEL